MDRYACAENLYNGTVAAMRDITHTDVSEEHRTITCKYSEPFVIGHLDREPLAISLARIEREDEADVVGHEVTSAGFVLNFKYARPTPGSMKGEVRIPTLWHKFDLDVEYRFSFTLYFANGAPIIHGPWPR